MMGIITITVHVNDDDCIEAFQLDENTTKLPTSGKMIRSMCVALIASIDESIDDIEVADMLYDLDINVEPEE